MILVFWIGCDDPAALEEELARLGIESRAYPTVVDDGILDVHVDVRSRAEARRVERELVNRCRERTDMKLEGAWAFGSPVLAVAHATRPPGARRLRLIDRPPCCRAVPPVSPSCTSPPRS
jgi:hypothetical protein